MKQWLSRIWHRIVIPIVIILLLAFPLLSIWLVESYALPLDPTISALQIATLALSIVLPLSFGVLVSLWKEVPDGEAKAAQRKVICLSKTSSILFAVALLIGLWNVERIPTASEHNLIKGMEARWTLTLSAGQLTLFAIGIVFLIRGIQELRK